LRVPAYLGWCRREEVLSKSSKKRPATPVCGIWLRLWCTDPSPKFRGRQNYSPNSLTWQPSNANVVYQECTGPRWQPKFRNFSQGTKAAWLHCSLRGNAFSSSSPHARPGPDTILRHSFLPILAFSDTASSPTGPGLIVSHSISSGGIRCTLSRPPNVATSTSKSGLLAGFIRP
jgi:hypothetical protein